MPSQVFFIGKTSSPIWAVYQGVTSHLRWARDSTGIRCSFYRWSNVSLMVRARGMPISLPWFCASRSVDPSTSAPLMGRTGSMYKIDAIWVLVSSWNSVMGGPLASATSSIDLDRPVQMTRCDRECFTLIGSGFAELVGYPQISPNYVPSVAFFCCSNRLLFL